MNEKVYIIHSEYVQNEMTFNTRTRYVKDKEHAIQIYNDTLKQMKEDNSDMISDKENYETNRGGQRTNRFFTCFYKYQPQVSNFLVEISAEILE